jgi:hypothetical protein
VTKKHEDNPYSITTHRESPTGNYGRLQWLVSFLWLVVALVGISLLISTTFAPQGSTVQLVRLCIGASLTGLACVGVLFRFGLVIPTSLIFAAFSILFMDPLTHGRVESLFVDCIYPFCAFLIGLSIGYVFDQKLNKRKV